VLTMADDQHGTDDSATLLQHIAQLEKQLERATKGSKGARGPSSKKTSSSKETGARDAAGRGKSTSGDGDVPRSSPDTHPCHIHV